MSRHYFSFSPLSRRRKPAPYLFCDLLCFSIQKGSVLFFGEKEKKERKEQEKIKKKGREEKEKKKA